MNIETSLARLQEFAKLITSNQYADHNPSMVIFIDPDKKGLTIAPLCDCDGCKLNHMKIVGGINRGEIKFNYNPKD